MSSAVETVKYSRSVKLHRHSRTLKHLMDLAAPDSTEAGPVLAFGELAVSADALKLNEVLDIYRRLHAQVTAKVGLICTLPTRDVLAQLMNWDHELMRLASLQRLKV